MYLLCFNALEFSRSDCIRALRKRLAMHESCYFFLRVRRARVRGTASKSNRFVTLLGHGQLQLASAYPLARIRNRRVRPFCAGTSEDMAPKRKMTAAQAAQFDVCGLPVLLQCQPKPSHHAAHCVPSCRCLISASGLLFRGSLVVVQRDPQCVAISQVISGTAAALQPSIASSLHWCGNVCTYQSVNYAMCILCLECVLSSKFAS